MASLECPFTRVPLVVTGTVPRKKPGVRAPFSAAGGLRTDGMASGDVRSNPSDDVLEKGERFSMFLYDAYWLYLPYPLTTQLSFRYEGLRVESTTLASSEAREDGDSRGLGAAFSLLLSATGLELCPLSSALRLDESEEVSPSEEELARSWLRTTCFDPVWLVRLEPLSNDGSLAVKEKKRPRRYTQPNTDYTSAFPTNYTSEHSRLFLFHYLNDPVPYVQRHITINEMCRPCH